MRKELINELRRRGLSNGTSLGRHDGIMDAAADEIERLQQENEQLRKHNKEAMQLLNKAIDCLRNADNCNGCKYAIDAEPCHCDTCDDMDSESCNEQCPWWGDICGLCLENNNWQWQHADKLKELGVEV